MTPVEWATLVVAVAWLVAAGAVGILAAVLVADRAVDGTARAPVRAGSRRRAGGP
jgi:hypothetical protein